MVCGIFTGQDFLCLAPHGRGGFFYFYFYGIGFFIRIGFYLFTTMWLFAVAYGCVPSLEEVAVV